MPTNGMTIDGLNTVSSLTAQDEVPVWDKEASGEPTRKITAQNMANSVKSLASLPNTTEMNTAIAQSTAKLEGLTVYNMVQADSTESMKPWLVLKRTLETMPTGILIGKIQAGMMFNYFGHKYSNNYATFIVDVYSQDAGIPYKVVNNNGSWLYTSISVGNYASF